MRFGVLLAALAALWVQPAGAATNVVFDGFANYPGGSAGIFHANREWVYVRLYKPMTTFSAKFHWFADFGASYCDDTMTTYCTNSASDTNGYDQLEKIDELTYRGHYNVPVSGWYGDTYLESGQIAGDGLQFSYTMPYGPPVRYKVIFSDQLLDIASGVPEPGTWALMLFGFGLAGGVMRRRHDRLQLPPEPVFVPVARLAP